MESLQKNMLEFKKQLKKGEIQKAYKGIMEYFVSLKKHFSNEHPICSEVGNVYFVYLDMTYLPISTKSLKDRDLKVAIVFFYDKFRFEIWLSGKNKEILKKYWNVFKESNWDKYRIVKPQKGVDSIVEHILVENPDFSDTESLSKQIDKVAVKFIKDIERLLSKRAA